MQISNNPIFSLNPASTPQMKWGELNPATEFASNDLALLPAGSFYIQLIGDPVTSSTGWFKALTDEAADTLAISPWTIISFPTVTSGTDYPDFASDEFVAYVPGMMYVQTATMASGNYRTAWLKISDGGERSNWLSIPESTAIEYIMVSITRAATWSVTATSDWATPTWTDATTGAPTVTINSTGTIGVVGSGMTLTVKTAGVYRITCTAAALATGSPTKGQLALKKNSTYYTLAQSATQTDKTLIITGSITLPLAVSDVLAVALAHDGGNGNITMARLELEGIGPTPA